MKKKFSEKLYKFAHLLELVLAVTIAIGVIVGLIELINHVIEIYKSEMLISYDVFKDFLSYVLILVVGVEFILMLLTHSPEVTAELVVFVIARKMLICSDDMVDMVLGALSLAIILTTLKLLTHDFKKNGKT